MGRTKKIPQEKPDSLPEEPKDVSQDPPQSEPLAEEAVLVTSSRFGGQSYVKPSELESNQKFKVIGGKTFIEYLGGDQNTYLL